MQIIRDNISVPLRYWVIATTTTTTASDWYLDPRFILTAWALVFVVPLSFFKSAKSLAYAFYVGFILVLYACVFVAVDCGMFLHGNSLPPTVHLAFNPSIRIALAFPSLIFSLDCHIGFPTISAELKRPSLRRHAFVAVVSLLVCGCLYSLIGVSGYLRWGEGVDPNILNNYAPSNVPATVARIGLAFSLTACFPLLLHISRATVAQLISWQQPSDATLLFYHIGFTACWLVASLALAIAIPRYCRFFSSSSPLHPFTHLSTSYITPPQH